MRIVHHSFAGRWSDSPRAVHERLLADGGNADERVDPTWRDDACFAEGRPDTPLALDVGRFAQATGEDWVLLPRLHSMMTDRMAPLRPGRARGLEPRRRPRARPAAADGGAGARRAAARLAFAPWRT